MSTNETEITDIRDFNAVTYDELAITKTTIPGAKKKRRSPTRSDGDDVASPKKKRGKKKCSLKWYGSRAS